MLIGINSGVHYVVATRYGWQLYVLYLKQQQLTICSTRVHMVRELATLQYLHTIPYHFVYAALMRFSGK